MTIDTKTGRSVIYICPVCEGETRGLENGMCAKCAERVPALAFTPSQFVAPDKDPA